MGRRSSGGFGRSRSTSTPRPKASPTPTPEPVKTAPSKAPSPAPVSRAPTIGESFVDGLGWGMGSEVGHRFVEAIIGPPTIKVESVGSPASSEASASPMDSKCGEEGMAFIQCITESTANISRCQFYMDALSQCQNNKSSSMMS